MSFHPNKNMTTGEGGAVITDDKDVISAMERLRFHGIDRNAFNRFAKGGSQAYDVVLPGFKYNMMDIQAALGLHQLPALAGFIEKRARLVERYKEKLSAGRNWLCPKHPITRTSTHGICSTSVSKSIKPASTATASSMP